MIVMKFGGTSVEDAHAISTVIDIVRHHLPVRPLVVLSATAGTTTNLITIAQQASTGRERDALALLQEVRRRHEQIAAALGLGSAPRAELEALFESHFAELMNLVKGLAILGDLTPRSLDTFCSYGERLSTAIAVRAMIERGISARHFDARRIMITDETFTRAAPLVEIIEQKVSQHFLPALEQSHVPVTEGYIGATVTGATTTLGRGGSDYTAAILGAALDADEIQIWTDVDGVLTADPRIVAGAKKVKILSFAEASELAYFGAKVLHPSTILPAISKNIPVRVLNSRKPDATGTIITSEIAPAKGCVKSIACKQGITMINVFSTRMLMAHGFLRRIFEVFEQFHTSVDLVSTSEVSVSVTVDNRDHLNQIVEALGAFSNVTVEENKAIICVVGEQLKYTPGIVGKVFKAIEDVNVFMISQGASEINVSFVIDEEKLPHVVQTLHEQFFSQAEEEIFE
jgi:aspartate kinase